MISLRRLLFCPAAILYVLAAVPLQDVYAEESGKKENVAEIVAEDNGGFLDKLKKKFSKEKSFGEAFQQGDMDFGVRFRFEDVNNGLEQDNSVVTLRSHLAYGTEVYRLFSLFGEMEDVRIIGGVDVDSTVVRGGFRSANNDPDTTEVNQLYLQYHGFKNTRVRLGRQRIIYGNGRFVGHSPWRQNERTYDAFSIENTRFNNTVLSYAFIDNVNTTFGGILDVNDTILNLAYSRPALGEINLYAVFLSDDTDIGNATLGVRLQGSHIAGDAVNLFYTAEIAGQNKAHNDVLYSFDSQPNNNAMYAFLEGGLGYNDWMIKVFYELLGSDGGEYSFDMPLGSEHDFNGWAGVFSITPDDGVQDVGVSLSKDIFRIRAYGEYHQFSADNGGKNYGREVDVMLFRTFDNKNNIGVKLASYSADGLSTDISKFWFWFSMNNGY